MSDQETKIRELLTSDLDGVRDVYSLYYSDKDLEHAVYRATQYIKQSKGAKHLELKYFVAEQEKEVVGVLGFIKTKEPLLPFCRTKKPVELYTLFVKSKKSGVGKALLEKAIAFVKEQGYKEIIVYSANKWKESWNFYDTMGFERVGTLESQEGGTAQIFRKILANTT